MHQATVAFANPKSAGFDYRAGLCMGTNLTEMASASFHLDAGQSKAVAFSVTMPATPGTYPVYFKVTCSGVLIGTFVATEDVVIVVQSSALLISYQAKLEEAYGLVEAGAPSNWVMIPGYGLQYAIDAIPQLESLMRTEAVRIGMIGTSAQAYFERAIMYFLDGTTIVPYWWPCPWCAERLRSPALLEQHIHDKHPEILAAKATITDIKLVTYSISPEPIDTFLTGVRVTWRNDSPFSIQGRVRLVLTYFEAITVESSQDAIVPAGQSITVSFSLEAVSLLFITATAELYLLPVMKLLDTKVVRS